MAGPRATCSSRIIAPPPRTARLTNRTVFTASQAQQPGRAHQHGYHARDITRLENALNRNVAGLQPQARDGTFPTLLGIPHRNCRELDAHSRHGCWWKNPAQTGKPNAAAEPALWRRYASGAARGCSTNIRLRQGSYGCRLRGSPSQLLGRRVLPGILPSPSKAGGIRCPRQLHRIARLLHPLHLNSQVQVDRREDVRRQHRYTSRSQRREEWRSRPGHRHAATSTTP